MSEKMWSDKSNTEIERDELKKRIELVKSRCIARDESGRYPECLAFRKVAEWITMPIEELGSHRDKESHE